MLFVMPLVGGAGGSKKTVNSQSGCARPTNYFGTFDRPFLRARLLSGNNGSLANVRTIMDGYELGNAPAVPIIAVHRFEVAFGSLWSAALILSHLIQSPSAGMLISNAVQKTPYLPWI